MGMRIVRGRHWIGLAYLSALLFGAMPGSSQAQLLGINTNTPNCIAQTAAPNLGLLPSQQWAGTFQPTCGQMQSAHDTYPLVIAMSNGQVLVAGGRAPLQGSPDIEEGTLAAEIYDSRLGLFLPVGNLAYGVALPNAAVLSSGQVLIATGAYGSGLSSLSQIYQPLLLSFAQVGPFAMQRNDVSFGLAAFGNNQALVAGGYVPGTILANADVYQSSSHSFVATGALHTARAYPVAVTLRDGRVLVAGGLVGFGQAGYPANATASAEIYNPATGTFTPTGGLITARGAPYAAVLNDGRVLFVAGSCGTGSCQLTSAELYDPASGSFSPTGALLHPVANGSRPFLMKNGKVLLGDQIYDPAKGTFSQAPGLPPTTYGSLNFPALLGTGQVLGISGVNGSTAAYLYQPPP